MIFLIHIKQLLMQYLVDCVLELSALCNNFIRLDMLFCSTTERIYRLIEF